MVSSLPTCVQFEVRRAERVLDKNLHMESYCPRGPVVAKFRLSTYQFAELISGMHGVGVPCTLDTIMGVRMDPPPEEAKTPLDQISSEAREEALGYQSKAEPEFQEALKGLEDHVDSLKLSFKKASEMKGRIRSLRKFVSAPVASAAWATQRLAEEAEKVKSQAAVEIAAAITTMAHKVGLKQLSEGGVDVRGILPWASEKE